MGFSKQLVAEFDQLQEARWYSTGPNSLDKSHERPEGDNIDVSVLIPGQPKSTPQKKKKPSLAGGQRAPTCEIA